MEVGQIERGEITLSVNGEILQQGDISDTIWSVVKVFSSLSSFFELCTRGLIFTGTPAGVGPLDCGDILEGKEEIWQISTLQLYEEGN